MGNSATKEQRPLTAQSQSSDRQNSSAPASSSSIPPVNQPRLDQPAPVGQGPDARPSRPDFFTAFGVGNPDRQAAGLDGRRETKQEREARKLEKERIAREKERERSMREEHVDGGYLVTQGVYTGTEDYNKGIVRQLMIERRIAPFWRGLNDHSCSWTEHQLVAAANNRPIPAADEVPTDEDRKEAGSSITDAKSSLININSLTVPISSRSQSFTSDTSSNLSPIQPTFPTGGSIPAANQTPSSLGSALSRGRAKTLASLTSSKSTQPELTPREVNLPKDPFVHGQPIEACLYKDASECPICFLYYPPYLNKTRCCDQPICSECFVQIKRPDPHPPEHADPSAPPRTDVTEAEGPEDELVSGPAACPFCKQPEFGVTYESPPFRRGLAYANHPSSYPLNGSTSAMSSMSSLVSATSIDGRMSPTTAGRRRTTSVSATSPLVITTDKVRPDWHQKLASARAHNARRSAAATALHTAAYLMGSRGHESDSRSFGAFGRRGPFRRASGADSPSGGASSSQVSMLALMSERYTAQAAARNEVGPPSDGEPSVTPGPRGSSRRGRIEDLEDMMMMEAIRLSLASEEERRKKEEKEAKKEAKKKEKENKKAEKVARKTGIYPHSANASTSALEESSQNAGKGKSLLPREPEASSEKSYGSSSSGDPQTHLERARAQLQPEPPTLLSPSPYGSTTPYRPSHLRTLSNASSSASSIEGSAPGSLRDPREPSSSRETSPHASGTNIPTSGPSQDSYISGTPPGGGAGTESMFNFRSLAAMVGDDEKVRGATAQIEDAGAGQAYGHQRGDSSGSGKTGFE